MEYFILSNSCETKEIGSQFPQIQTLGGTIDAKASNSLYNVMPNKFPDFSPNLDYLILHPKANLTDFLSAAMIDSGFLISGKVKRILEQSYLMEHKFYPAKIKHGDVIHENYYWFFYIADLSNYIDYNKTEFLIVDSFGDVENTSIKSKDDLFKAYQNMSTLKNIRSRKIIFQQDFKNQYDLFYLQLADNRTYISEKLKKIFKQLMVTGYATLPATILV